MDLTRCRPHKDFGKGFYTTAIREQAELMAQRTARRFGGQARVAIFQIDDAVFHDPQFSRLTFAEPTLEWALFVLNNRYPERKKSLADGLANLNHEYDLVEGPVANDDLDLTFNLFVSGVLSDAELVARLQYKKLNRQTSFHSAKIVKYLVKKGGADV